MTTRLGKPARRASRARLARTSSASYLSSDQNRDARAWMTSRSFGQLLDQVLGHGLALGLVVLEDVVAELAARASKTTPEMGRLRLRPGSCAGR